MADTLSNKESGTAVSSPPKRERSPILEGEDRALEDNTTSTPEEDTPGIKTIEEKELDHKHKIEEDKIKMGSNLLVACFCMIAIFALIDFSLRAPNESTLFSGAFEFAKTIATAMVGYLFATNSKDK